MSSASFANSLESAAINWRPRRASGSRITALVVGVAVVVFLGAAAPAGAHLRSGTVAVDYRASVFHPETTAYSAQIFQSDRALGVTVKPGHTVVLLGYLGEPAFRLDATGLWVNASSPTAAVLRLVKRSKRSLPLTPRWLVQRGRHSVIWPDARAQGLPSGVSRGRWTVPLIVDGRPSRLDGELRRFPAPSLSLWLGILAVLLAGGALPLLLRRRDLFGPVSIAFGVVAALACGVVLVAFALDAYASPGTWIEAVDAIAFLGVGVWALLRAPQHWHVGAAIGMGLVAVAVGLLEGAIFLHPIALAVLPGTATRLWDILALGAGLDAAVLGGLVYVEQGGVLPTDPALGVPVAGAGIQR